MTDAKAADPGHILRTGFAFWASKTLLSAVANEHIYWDQASVLVQNGLLDPSTLPVAGVETARKVADPSLPSNNLMQMAGPSGELREHD